MNEMLEERVRAAVRHLAEEPVIEAKVFVPQEKTRRVVRLLAPIAVAAAAVAATMVVTLAPQPGGRSHGGGPVLPREFGRMSPVDLSEAPLGQPGLAVLGHRAPGTSPSTSAGTSPEAGQVVIVGADGRTYRRVDLAGRRGAAETGGQWYPTDALLSPDGTRVAVGDKRISATEIPVLDLAGAKRHDYPLPEPVAYQLKAWSPDGRKLAVALDDTLAILNLDTGTITTVPVEIFDPLGATVQFASPSRLGLPTVRDPESATPTRWLTVVDFKGDDPVTVVDTMRIPEGWVFAGWTPAGEVLLFSLSGGIVEVRTVRFTDGGDVRQAVRIPAARASLLGWRGPTVMLAYVTDAADGDRRIVAVDLERGGEEPVSTFENGSFLRAGNANAVGSLVVMAASSTTSGRTSWPLWTYLALATTAVLITTFVAWRLRRLQHRPPSPAPPPPDRP